MENILLQSAGIDIAKEKFDVCFKQNKEGRAIIKLRVSSLLLIIPTRNTPVVSVVVTGK